MPIQMAFSSSHLGSKERGLFQVSPRVASKRDVVMAKLNYTSRPICNVNMDGVHLELIAKALTLVCSERFQSGVSPEVSSLSSNHGLKVRDTL
ncbi:hypothetical protein AVEN_35072-1 [Araneus ventricosus]|uniref:Uncharacterized protein n=1 Tax=Araneus ventricosus TaxID=182803 RepID=A0A4Y2J911_ARAVE|nr:hypothetical protein AVEN_35072-1 [Araneus ventricosus]